MIKLCKKTKTLRVCNGAGCKAWGAEKILLVFKESMRQFSVLSEYRLQAGRCMSECGGGASIHVDGKVYKARDTENAVNILFQEQRSSPFPSVGGREQRLPDRLLQNERKTP